MFAIPRLYHTNTTLSNTENPAATPPSLPSAPLVLQANTPLAPPRLPPQMVHMWPKMPSSGRLLKSPRFCHFHSKGAARTRYPPTSRRVSIISIAIHVSCSSARRLPRNTTFEHARAHECFLDFLTACEMQGQ
jgi:hypothetical protein